VKRKSKEQIKSVLKTLRLYRPAVYVYCKLETLHVSSRDQVHHLYSPFLNMRFKRQGVTDGLPFPPTRLVYLVTNTYRYDWFYKSGILGAGSIRDVLEKNDLEISRFEAILDFGCGCGRVMRQWKTLNGPILFGTDYNPILVSWCQKNLPFAEFMVNRPSLPLSYRSEAFYFIYAISVFTHLDEVMGNFWIKELSRVLKPGGVVYMTVMGAHRVAHLPHELQEQFEAGHLVVTGKENLFRNTCATYHPQPYVQRMLPEGIQILDFIPGAAIAAQRAGPH
jgi:SAM-dependent methyltransferase